MAGSGEQMNGYDPARWHYLFQSASSSSGALAGLIFVALVPNIDRLLEYDTKLKGRSGVETPRPMMGRAREALIGLLTILVLSIVALTPHLLNWVLAAFMVLAAAVSAVSPLRSSLAVHHGMWHRMVVVQRFSCAYAFSLCLLTCGVTLAIGVGGGLFWMAAAYVIAIVQASGNTWMLAVEVRRGLPVKPTRARR